MKKLFAGKYRIPSARLVTWNYDSEGMYFVTICTKNHHPYFGKILTPPAVSGITATPVLQPTEIGTIAHNEWYRTPGIRPDMNLLLAEFVVMPNHVHGIIIIGDRRDAMHGVSTSPATFGPQSKNLASIIRGYKSAVTTYARKNNIPFEWQPRFHDHIIRSADSFHRIAEYIRNNPENWKGDKFFR